MAKNRSRSANNQRSNVKNPNNPAYHKAQGNRGAQLNPNQLPPARTRPPSDKTAK